MRAVNIRIGALRQVVPETLSYCWSLVNEGGLLDGAVLDIDFVGAEAQCDDCGARTKFGRGAWGCGACGGRRVRVVAGEEFDVVSIDVDD